jgi:hypothetical protein
MFHQAMNCFPANFQCVAKTVNVIRTVSYNFRRQAVIFHENFAMLDHLHLAVMRHLGTYGHEQKLEKQVHETRTHEGTTNIYRSSIPLRITPSKHSKICARRISLSSETERRQ